MSPVAPCVTQRRISFRARSRLAQADERAARVVLTPPSEANSVGVLVKHRKRLVRCPMPAIGGGNNQGLELERQKEIGLAVLEHLKTLVEKAGSSALSKPSDRSSTSSKPSALA